MLPDFPIAAPDPVLGRRVRAAIDAKSKPPGSLGRIEALALQIALAQGSERPMADPARLFIFAGDHGLVAEGVSAWPQEVTAQMVRNFLAGGAASTVFARVSGAEVTVVDAGVAGEIGAAPGLVRAGIRRGTRNATGEDALTRDEVRRAMALGARLAADAAAEGARVVALGEMGIGNTSSAALVAHAVAEIELGVLVGPGAGLDAHGIDHKLAVLARAAGRRPGPLAPEDALAAFGGLEIAAMAGAVIGAASRRAVVLVDGFIATAAALAALAARPEVRPYCVFAHRSREGGHRRMLDWLEVEPLIDLDLCLGEGTGALLALPLLRAACAMLNEMATFESAGVSGRGT